MRKEDLEAFINNLELLIATGSPYVHKMISVTPFTTDDMTAYMIEDSCNSDITLVVPPSVKNTIGFGFWKTDVGTGKHGKVRVIGGGEKLTGLDCLFEGLIADSIDCSELDVSNVTEAEFLFCTANIKHLDLEWLRGAKLKHIKAMFRGAVVDKIDLNCLDVTSCESYSELFKSCNAEIVGELHSNKVINTSSMFSMYKGNHKLDLSWLDMSKVIDCSHMFNSVELIKLTIDLSNANEVEDAYNMFYMSNVRKLTYQIINMDNLKDGKRMFYMAKMDDFKLKSKAHQIEGVSEMFSHVTAGFINLAEFEIKTNSKITSLEMMKQAKTKFILCKRQVGGHPSEGWMKLTLLFGNNKNVSFIVE